MGEAEIDLGSGKTKPEHWNINSWPLYLQLEETNIVSAVILYFFLIADIVYLQWS